MVSQEAKKLSYWLFFKNRETTKLTRQAHERFHLIWAPQIEEHEKINVLTFPFFNYFLVKLEA